MPRLARIAGLLAALVLATALAAPATATAGAHDTHGASTWEPSNAR